MVRDHTSVVPDEIFWKFFDEWPFAELQSALRVSVRWRRLLLVHPSYWRSITLGAPTLGAAALFIVRMSRAEMRPVLVIVDLQTSWEALSATVFPALRVHGSHIESLYVTVHAADAPGVPRYLNVPFPLLRRFRFIVRMADCVSNRAVLPTNLFLEQANALEDVLLRDIDLRVLPVPALGCAWSVSFSQGSRRSPPYPLPDLFCHFPKMTRFWLDGATSFADPAYYDLEKWSQIRVFLFNGYRYLLEPLLTRSQPLASIRCVHMVNANSFIADSMFAHLSGLLELVVLDTDREHVGTFETCLMDERHIVRSFRETSRRWEKRESIDHNWIDHPDMATRLVSLCISNTLWDRVVPFLPSPLPSLVELRIIMEPEPDRRHPLVLFLHYIMSQTA
ncbi:hypothetical protein EXIGLDRAFT_784313 [Exidia glandulosa HHB12029]|uniref:F-box domain-containing protein n=1 Tax=Exidia glandulosa HHB12029 TaxID=1314781 RepID=A0A166MJ70_EXIGL|nr:hypothetical protein EXIGLDRAFT_784313 [Exidia glandulosa HHB12029]